MAKKQKGFKEKAKDLEKKPRSSVDEGSLTPRFRWNHAEDDGPHGKWSDLNFQGFKDVLIKLREFEHQNRQELRGAGCHRCEYSGLSKELREKFGACQFKDDAENLWSFKVGNLPRVWAVWLPPETYVLWHDPLHDGFPTKRK